MLGSRKRKKQQLAEARSKRALITRRGKIIVAIFITILIFGNGHICDRFWENPYKRGKYHYSISSVLVISLIFVKIFFIMKMDVWNIVLGPGKDIRSGTHYNSRSKPNTVLKFLTSRAASIRKTGTRP